MNTITATCTFILTCYVFSYLFTRSQIQKLKSHMKKLIQKENKLKKREAALDEKAELWKESVKMWKDRYEEQVRKNGN